MARNVCLSNRITAQVARAAQEIIEYVEGCVERDREKVEAQAKVRQEQEGAR